MSLRPSSPSRRSITRFSLALLIAIAIATAALLAALAADARADGGTGDACAPPRLMLLLDKSSSMQTGTIGGASKWSIAVDALDAVAAEFEATVELGLMTFPNPDECSPGDVDVAPALFRRAAMLDVLDAPPPSAGNWTPMAQTMEAAAAEPSLLSAPGPRYALLVTDGWQWCSPYEDWMHTLPIEAIGALNAAGITTYVVGFGGATDALTLNTVAVMAGTARAGCDPTGEAPTDPDPCYYQADDPAELLAALTEILAEVETESCDGLDNDCDGQIDEALQRPCATACGAGAETCSAGAWVGCDAVPVAPESCDGADNDCDGTVDPGCDCTVGDSRPCGGELGAGACHPGTQTCDAAGVWGDCAGATGPSGEMCDGVDNDCDDDVDEVDDDVITLCGPGARCEDGECQPVDPVPPPAGEDGHPDDGAAVATCACVVGADPGAADYAGGLALLAAVAAFLAGRRRGRRA